MGNANDQDGPMKVERLSNQKKVYQSLLLRCSDGEGRVDTVDLVGRRVNNQEARTCQPGSQQGGYHSLAFLHKRDFGKYSENDYSKGTLCTSARLSFTTHTLVGRGCGMCTHGGTDLLRSLGQSTPDGTGKPGSGALGHCQGVF